MTRELEAPRCLAQDAQQQSQNLSEAQKANNPKIQATKEQMARAAARLHQRTQDAGPRLRLRVSEKSTKTLELEGSQGWERELQVEGWHHWKIQPGQHNLNTDPRASSI